MKKKKSRSCNACGKKQDEVKSYEMRENELKKISNEEILKMNFLNHKDYSYLYSIEEFNDWGKKSNN